MLRSVSVLGVDGCPGGWIGAAAGQRLRALAGWVDVGDLAEVPPAVRLDDALDALAAAWSAARNRDGAAESIGDGEPDARGLRMEIVA